jgi:choline-sulfatase
MNGRSRSGLYLSLSLSLALVASVANAGTDRDSRPNLLILMTDDQAAYTLGVDGDRMGATPRLDRLARQGTYFSRTYCVSPLCTPSRQAFLAGRYPHAVGVTSLGTPLKRSVLTMAEWLHDQGYATAALGKMHFNSNYKHGFDLLLDTPDWKHFLQAAPPPDGAQRTPWRPFSDPAAQWLNAANRSTGISEPYEEASFLVNAARKYFRMNRNERFYLVVSLHEPHAPFAFPREWEGRYRPEEFPVRTTSEADLESQPLVFRSLSSRDAQGIQAAYYTSLAYADSQLGRVLDALEAEGLADRTLVVFWSDNGYMLGHHARFEKHVMYEPAVRVPLIVRWPGKLPSCHHTEELLETIDVFPTLMTLMGLPIPQPVQGQDLSALFRDDPGAHGRDAVFSEYLDSEEAMIRTNRYKLIVGAGQHERTDGFRSSRPPEGRTIRLFDLHSDPEENVDLAREPAMQPRIREMKRLMLERFRSTWREGRPRPRATGDDQELDEYLMSSEARGHGFNIR